MRLTIFVQPSNRCKVATKFQSAIFSTCQNHRCDWRSQMEEVDILSMEKRDCQSFYLSATAVKIPERRNQTNAATEVDVGVQGLEQSGTGIYRGLYLVVVWQEYKSLYTYRAVWYFATLVLWCSGTGDSAWLDRSRWCQCTGQSSTFLQSGTLVLWYRGLCLTGVDVSVHRLASSNRPPNDLAAVFYCCLLMLLLLLLMLLLLRALCCSCCCAHSGSNVLHMLNSISCVPLLCARLKWSSRLKKEKTSAL